MTKKLTDPYEGKREFWLLDQETMKARWRALDEKYMATPHMIQEDTAAFYEELIANGVLVYAKDIKQ